MQSGSFEVVTVKRILFVDDDPALLRLVAKVLARDYDVVTSPSAQDALDRLRRGDRFDAILADDDLPGMAADTFLHELGALALDLPRKVAFVTDTVDSHCAAVTPWLAKPFQVEALRSFVDALLTTASVAEPTAGAPA